MTTSETRGHTLTEFASAAARPVQIAVDAAARASRSVTDATTRAAAEAAAGSRTAVAGSRTAVAGSKQVGHAWLAAYDGAYSASVELARSLVKATGAGALTKASDHHLTTMGTVHDAQLRTARKLLS